MIHFKDIDYIKFDVYNSLIEYNLPKNYSYGYIGNIWGKWQSDDRYFYIEDSKGKKINGYFNINEIDSLWKSLKKHLNIKENKIAKQL